MKKTLDSEKIVYKIVKKVLENRPDVAVNDRLVNDITAHTIKKFPLKEIIFDKQTHLCNLTQKINNHKKDIDIIDEKKLSRIIKILALVSRSIDSIVLHKGV